MNNRISTRNWQRGWLTSTWVVVMIVMAALLLAACQPAQQPAASQTGSQGVGAGGQRPNFQMEPTKELPTTQPIVRGVVVKLDGNTLTVQEGNGGFGFGGGANGTPRPRPTPDGTPRPRPTLGGGTDVQVDVSGATVYQDVTFANLNGQPPSGTIQQVVQASSLTSLASNDRVTIWGDQNGNQITAKVVVYSQPRSSQQQ